MLTDIQGGEGGEELTRQVIRVLSENKADFAPSIPMIWRLKRKSRRSPKGFTALTA